MIEHDFSQDATAKKFKTDHTLEFRRLTELEYGDVREVVFRFVAIAFCGFALFTYTGWMSVFAWLGLYAASHLLLVSYAKADHDRITSRHTTILGLIFLSVVVAFTWMLAHLLTMEDNVLKAGGAAGLTCTMIWLIRRSDTLPFIVFGVIAIFAAIFGYVLWWTIGGFDTLLTKLVIACCTASIVGYFGSALLSARRLRIQALDTQQRTLEAQKMEAIGRLAGGVAHDFNNVLTACLGNLELYREVSSQAERDDCVHQAHLAAERGGAIIKKLLAYSRRKAEHQPVPSVQAHLDMVRTLSRPLMPAPISLRVTHPSPDISTPADAEGLTTALLNLLVNARDSMPRGGSIRMGAQVTNVKTPMVMIDGEDLRPGDYVCFEVRDNGSGIPGDVIDRVFEPFFTTKPVGLGSGLGLAMVVQFANESDGGFQIRSSERGTTAALYLPVGAL